MTTTIPREAKGPTETGQRSVATLFDGHSNAEPCQTATRPCKYCSAPFSPVRQAQEFRPGGACREAWWKEHRRDERHTCTCGEPHEPAGGPWLQEPVLWGQMFLRFCEASRIELPATVRGKLGAEQKVVTVTRLKWCPDSVRSECSFPFPSQQSS